MKVYYFIHVTGTDNGISGVPRVVRNLGRELVQRSDVELVPVCWSENLQAIVHAEQKLLDNFSRNGGPELQETSLALQPIAPEDGDWLLVAEVPHLQSYYPDYQPVLIDGPIGCARRLGLKVAVVVHDLLPLTHTARADRGRLFADMLLNDGRSDAGELQRMRFTGYAHALALADIVLAVSRTTGDLLSEWLVRHGHRGELLPPIAPVVLPEEVDGAPRAIPGPTSENEDGPIEFLSVGSVCAHKNQLSAMAGFHRLIEKRPDLDLRLNLAGWVGADLAVPASLIAKRAKGRIVLHGRLPDRHVRDLMRRARATVFISLAEGYGLPVAESLWYGKPCLCSGEGSIAEIARGGGCLTVNPRSLGEIEAGFETLASDRARYRELLQQIAARRMKTWKQYAGEVVDALVAVSSGRGLPVAATQTPVDVLGVGAPENEIGQDSPHDAILIVSASDLNIHEAYDAKAGRARSIYYSSAIRYDQQRDGAVEQDVLFFGPYIPLPAGRYAFQFDGEVDGELRLAFTANTGRLRIAEVALTAFDKPVPLDLPEAVEKLEIVGMRTPSLRRLTLRGVFGELRGEGRRSRGRPPAAASEALAATRVEERLYARDNDGRGLILPYAFPADRMRVHDAFGVGSANRLRANATISFNRGAHADVAESILFYGPYLHLEPGDYRFRFRGELDGALRVRLTRNFAAEGLLETVLTDFRQPFRLRLEHPAENFEIVGDRTDSTRSMILHAIEMERDGEEAAAKAPRPIALRSDDGRELNLPVVWPASAMRVHDAFGQGEANRLRAGKSIVFDAGAHGEIEEPVLFFGPYLHLEPGRYSFRFHGVLQGSLRLRFTTDFTSRCLREVVATEFETPVHVDVEQAAEKVEFIGERTEDTRAMRLESIEIGVAPLAP